MAWRKVKQEPEEVEETEEEQQEEIPKLPELPKLSVPKRQREVEKVVNELPQMPLRRVTGSDGTIFNLTPIDEAVQEIRMMVREILNIAREE